MICVKRPKKNIGIIILYNLCIYVLPQNPESTLIGRLYKYILYTTIYFRIFIIFYIHNIFYNNTKAVKHKCAFTGFPVVLDYCIYNITLYRNTRSIFIMNFNVITLAVNNNNINNGLCFKYENANVEKRKKKRKIPMLKQFWKVEY